MRAYLDDCERILLREIADKKFKRKEIALTYAMAFDSYKDLNTPVDWAKVNTAIVQRWSHSGLEYIKQLAWQHREDRRKAAVTA